MNKLLTALRKALPAATLAWAGLAAAAPCPHPLRVGLAERGYAAYRTTTGYGGISVDILQAAAQRTGCTLEFLWFPSARLMHELRAGRIDIAATMLQDEQRDSYALFLPYGYMMNFLVSSKRRYGSLSAFQAQSAARLNVVRGLRFSAAVQAQLQPLAQQARIEEVNDYTTLFRKMAAGRAEAAVMSPWVYLWHARQIGLELPLETTQLAEDPPAKLGMYLSRATLSEETTKAFAGALQKMLEDRSIQDTFAHYLDSRLAAQLFAPGTRPLLAGLSSVSSPQMSAQICMSSMRIQR